jgi:hypothetical protein
VHSSRRPFATWTCLAALLAPSLTAQEAEAPAAPPVGDPGLKYAPAPMEVEGMMATPIDVLSVSGTADFDLKTAKAEATAVMRFRMSATGHPIFDLRQDIAKAWLDGAPVDPADMASHDFGPGASTLRVLNRQLEAGSEHELRFEYPLRQPQSRQSDPIGWGDLDTLTWDFFFSDLNPGRYLEMWFPSNLIYDSFPFTLELDLRNAGAKHLLWTNGTVEERGEHSWTISFPANWTPVAQMVTVVPAKDVKVDTKEVKLPDGQKVTLEVAVRNDAGTTLKQVIKQTEVALKEFTESTGPWPHGERCVIYVWPGSRSMEYNGGTTTAIGALEHELFHSWYARGVMPADQNTGWLDEAWTMVNTSKLPSSWMKGKVGAPVQLAFPNPWNRTTPGLSYSSGAQFFMRLMGRVGEKKFRELMAAFYVKNVMKVASTEDLRDFLIAETGDAGIHQMFERYVFGKDVEVPK